MAANICRPSVGPIFARTEGTWKVWLRGSKEYCHALLRPFHPDSPDGARVEGEDDITFELVEELDWTGVQEVQPGRYWCTTADGTRDLKDLEVKDSAVMITIRDEATDQLRMFLGSCRSSSVFDRNFKASDMAFVNAMAQVSIDLSILCGDQFYADPLGRLSMVLPRCLSQLCTTFKQYCSQYQKAFTTPGIKEMLRTVPTHMILDDHEIFNNFKGIEHYRGRDKWPQVQAGLIAYNAYQLRSMDRPVQVPNAGDPHAYHYQFTHGDHRFFVLDLRTRRSTQDNQLSLLGVEQLNQLTEWIEDSGPDGISFIVTSKPMAPVKDDGEGWYSATAERTAILDTIARLPSENRVVFLGGDSHASMAATIRKTDKEGKDRDIAHSIVSSGLKSTVHRRKCKFKLGRRVAFDDEDGYWYASNSADLPFTHSPNYAIVTVSPDHDVMTTWYHRKTGAVLKTCTYPPPAH